MAHGLVETGVSFPNDSIQTSAASKVPAGTYINRIDTSGQSLAGGRVNEGSNLIVSSPDGTPFTTVLFASYGTPSGTFPNFTLGSCHSSNSKTVVEGYLLGNTYAVIPATNIAFGGDPCGGTAKRLAVVAATASGNLAVIDGFVSSDAAYSKSQYPALHAAMGNETNASMLPNINNWGTWDSTGNATNFGASTGDRRIDKIATNGNGTWIVLGDAGRIYRSTNDGVSWSLSTPTGTNDLISCAAYGDNFVIGSSTGANQYYSINAGATWTAGTEPTSSNDWGYAYSPVHGWWLKTIANGNILRSTNQGATWTLVLDLTGDSANKIAYGNGYFVVVDGAGNGYASANGGTSWTSLGNIAGGSTDNFNSIKFRNGRFFAVGDNGNIAYTQPNTNPLQTSNWNSRTSIYIRGGTTDTTSEITDVEYIDHLGIWLLWTTTSTYFWAADYGQEELMFYQQTGSGLFGATSQGYGKLMYANGTLVIADIGQSGTDGYGNPVYTNGVARSKLTSVTTPPSTHFWVPRSYQNTSLYFGQSSQVYVKT